MSQATFTRIAARKAAEICSLYPVDADAQSLLHDEATPAAYFDLLMDQRRFAAAIRFLCHALPKREAVGWACLCLRATGGPHAGEAPAAALSAALSAAELWVREPNEDHRRACHAAAEQAGYGTPAGCLAAAAFFSGGSLAPAHVPEVPPGPTLTAQCVAGALMLAAVQREPERIDEKYRAFLGQGIQIASGTRLIGA
jgi:hypothetical protein